MLARAGAVGRIAYAASGQRLAVGLGLIVSVSRPDLRHEGPQATALIASGRRRRHRHLVSPNLNRGLGIGPQVLKPAGVRRRSTLGGDDDPTVAIGAVDERRRPCLAGCPSFGGEEKDRRSPPVVATLAGGLPVDPNVLVTKQIVV